MTPLLSIKKLNVWFDTVKGVAHVVRDLGFSMGKEKIGIVGESGSGKSMTARAILGLIKAPGAVKADEMMFKGMDLLTCGKKAVRGIRGKGISMIMQDPKYSLNPVMTVGRQIAEAYRIHNRASQKAAKIKTLEMLAAVKIRNPERVYHIYPHEVSGGMGQRIMIAMMLIPQPDLLIADEPTSALDVTVRMEVLQILDDLVTNRGMGLIFISHDLNLVSAFCDRVLVMYGGKILEECRAPELHQAKHPYTRGLLNCLPGIDKTGSKLPIIERDDSWLD